MYGQGTGHGTICRMKFFKHVPIRDWIPYACVEKRRTALPGDQCVFVARAEGRRKGEVAFFFLISRRTKVPTHRKPLQSDNCVSLDILSMIERCYSSPPRNYSLRAPDKLSTSMRLNERACYKSSPRFLLCPAPFNILFTHRRLALWKNKHFRSSAIEGRKGDAQPGRDSSSNDSNSGGDSARASVDVASAAEASWRASAAATQGARSGGAGNAGGGVARSRRNKGRNTGSDSVHGRKRNKERGRRGLISGPDESTKSPVGGGKQESVDAPPGLHCGLSDRRPPPVSEEASHTNSVSTLSQVRDKPSGCSEK